MSRVPGSIAALAGAALALALMGCTPSETDRAGGRGLQDVTVLEIAQPDDTAGVQLTAFADVVEKQSHGALRLHFNDRWHQGEVDFEKHTLDDVTHHRMPGASIGVRSLDLIGVTTFQPLVAPMLVDSHATQSRIFSQGIPLEMARGLEGHGLVALAVLPGPMRKVLGARKPIREPADLRGLVLGIQGGEVPEATAKALGASYTRIQSGARLAGADAYESSVESRAVGLYGLEAKYVTTNLNLWPQVTVVVLDEKSYRGLTDAEREVLRVAARAVIEPAFASTREEEAFGVAKLCGQKMTFAESSRPQLDQVRRAVQPVYDLIAADARNAKMLDRIMGLKESGDPAPDVAVCPTSGGGAARPASQPDSDHLGHP